MAARRGFSSSRRRFLEAVGAAVLAGGTASACTFRRPEGDPGAGADTIRVGFVSPETGALAPFAEADQYVVAAFRDHFARNPIRVGGRPHAVEILKRDSQSDPNRAADVAADLIVNSGVHLILVSSTSDTTNPVSDQCEASGVPCVATATPWQPWYSGRGGRPDSSFEWTFLFFWGLGDVAAVYTDMWDQLATNRTTGALWADDRDGLAMSNPTGGFSPAIAQRGYSIVDPGNYPKGTHDFSSEIAAFRDANAEVLLGTSVPPDFPTFWQQAVQLDYRPRVATIGKALLVPSSVEALDPPGANLSTEVWWSPSHPFTSPLTGQSAAALADAYTQSTGRQWTQPLGFAHALFEVAAAAFTAAEAIDDPRAIADAIARLRLDTIVGPLDWSAGPVPNVATTPVVGGQWRPGATHPFELVIVSNAHNPEIPAAGTVEPLDLPPR
jgi:branched-chain amino acid transport system substrate-binding protein